jgi:hypothetical protein
MLKTDVNGNVPVRSIHKYFTSHDQLRIPAWQRDYSWDASDEGQVGVLLDDLANFAKQPAGAEYLLGSVILCDNDDSIRPSWLVIDGQQRSLTLSIFIFCAIKHIQLNALIKDYSDPLTAHTYVQLLECVSGGGVSGVFVPRLAMNNPDADDVIKNVWAWTQTAGHDEPLALAATSRTQTERNIREVADYIFDRLSREELFPGIGFLEGIKRVLNSIKLVELNLDSRKEALAVYDRINNRGLVLSSADLVKNQIFMNISDEEFDDVSASWLEMGRELNSTGKARLQDPKFLLRLMATIKKGDKITYDDLVDYWGSQIDVSTGEISALAFADELTQSASSIKRFALLQQLKEANGANPAVEVGALYLPHEMGSVQHYALLLAGKHFDNPETLRMLGEQVAHRAVLYVFARERTGQFESIIPKWANQISVLPSNAKPDDIRELFAEYAFHKDAPVSVLRENLRTAIRNWDYRNSSDRKKMRCVFALLNMDLSHDFSAKELMRTRKRAEEKKGWDIDHIMPKSKTDDSYVNQIGNLTLLAPNENSAIGASLPFDKAEANTYSQSNVFLTKMLDDRDALTSLQQRQIDRVLEKRNLKQTFSLRDWSSDAAATRADFLAEWLEQILIEQYL